MQHAKTKYQDVIAKERTLASFIPYKSHVNDTTLVTKDGDYVRCWKLGGISFETKDIEDIHIRKTQLNTLLRSIGSDNVALWTHSIRRQVSDRLVSHYDNEFAREFDRKYYDSFAGYRMMANELYLTAVFRPVAATSERVFTKISRRSLDEIKADRAEAVRRLDQIAAQIESSLKPYSIEPLAVFYKDGVAYSKQLELLNFLVSGEWQSVRLPRAPLDEYLGTSWVFAGTETIEIRSPTRTRFAQCIDFKEYSAHTEPGILNGLMYEDYEFVVTQSFSFMSKRLGKEFLEKQRNQLQNTEDGSVTQIEEMDHAIDQLVQGQFAMGEYHYSLMIFGETVAEVQQNTKSATTIIQNQGFLAALVTTALDAAFYAQLPANWAYRPRIAGLTSKNFAGLCSFHNFFAGKRDGNPWGQAVTLFKTTSGQPLYFNFHATQGDEDFFDKKVLGNTRIIGMSGSGKTVLMNTLFMQAQKYAAGSKFSTVFLDKDEGAKLCILATGGKYLSVKNGEPTGFNPLQLDETEENLIFLDKLLRVLASHGGQTVTVSEEIAISQAIRTVMKMPKAQRRLSVVLQNIPESSDIKARDNSLAKRLSKWCADDGSGRSGVYAWVLDCPTDELDFTTHRNIGIDGTEFLDNTDVSGVITMYLLHRMEDIIDGRRFACFIDEAHQWIGTKSEAFVDFAGNKQVTIRKQNGILIYATQMPSQIIKSKIASELVQQVSTEIYLPNERADLLEYTQFFKLSDAEFKLVKDLQAESRMFLIKQGHQSMLGRLDLNGFDDELAIMSGSTDNNALADEIMAEINSTDPADWIPIFHQRRKARSAAAKLHLTREI